MCDKVKTQAETAAAGQLVSTLAYEKQGGVIGRAIGNTELKEAVLRAADVPYSVENKVPTMLEDAELRIQNTQRELNRLYEVRTRLIQQGVGHLPRDYFSFYDF